MKLISIKRVVKSGLGVALIAMMLIAGPANAADPIQCKGLENNACLTEESCSWVNGYERKDGRTVNAFCRTKAKSKSTSSTAAETNDKAS